MHLRLKKQIFIPALAFFTAAFLLCLTALELKYEHDLVNGREQAAAHLQAYNQAFVRADLNGGEAAAGAELLLHSELFTVKPAMALRSDGTLLELEPESESGLDKLWDQKTAAAVSAAVETAEDGKLAGERAVEKVKAQYLRLDRAQALLRFVPEDGG